MRIRVRSESTRGQLLMSAMIDVVFLLLVFFIVTFRIVAPEGDLSIAPAVNAAAPAAQVASLPIHVYLRSNDDGSLQQVGLNARAVADVESLQREIVQIVETDLEDGRDLEAVIHCDRRLKYNHVIQAISAIRGYRDGGGRIVELVPRVRLDTQGSEFPPHRSP